MLNVLIKESYAMPSCLYNEHIQILPREGGKQGAPVRVAEITGSLLFLLKQTKYATQDKQSVFSMFCPVFSFNLPKSIYQMLPRQKNEYCVVTGQLTCICQRSQSGVTCGSCLIFNNKIQNILSLLQTIYKMHFSGWISHCDNTQVASLIENYPILILNSLYYVCVNSCWWFYLFSVWGKAYIQLTLSSKQFASSAGNQGNCKKSVKMN